MNIFYFDHTLGELTKLLELLEAKIGDDLLSIGSDNPDIEGDSIGDNDLLILHTCYPQDWINWVQENNQKHILFVSREPDAQLQHLLGVENGQRQTCTYYDRSIRDKHFSHDDFDRFLNAILETMEW